MSLLTRLYRWWFRRFWKRLSADPEKRKVIMRLRNLEIKQKRGH